MPQKNSTTQTVVHSIDMTRATGYSLTLRLDLDDRRRVIVASLASSCPNLTSRRGNGKAVRF